MSSQGRSSLGYLRPYRGIIAAGVISLIATNASYLGVAEYLKQSVQALKDSNGDLAKHAVALLVVFSVLTAVTRIFSRVWIFNAARAAE